MFCYANEKKNILYVDTNHTDSITKIHIYTGSTSCNYYLADINECDSSPCRNNGTCEDAMSSYNCICVQGYTGHNCETGRHCCVGYTMHAL